VKHHLDDFDHATAARLGGRDGQANPVEMLALPGGSVRPAVCRSKQIELSSTDSAWMLSTYTSSLLAFPAPYFIFSVAA